MKRWLDALFKRSPAAIADSNASLASLAFPPPPVQPQRPYEPRYATTESDWREISTMLEAARSVVVITGAGISVESGVPVYRYADDALWESNDLRKVGTMAGFLEAPEPVWAWHEHWRMTIAAAQPNAAHKALATLEGDTRRLDVITQNKDDLHERAGSRRVHHFHGKVTDPKCARCDRAHPFAVDEATQSVPLKRCECGGLIRPGIVFFGEPVSTDVIDNANRLIEAADLVIVIGTSLSIEPASRLPFFALSLGKPVIQINTARTSLDDRASMNIRAPASEALSRLAAEVLVKSEHLPAHSPC